MADRLDHYKVLQVDPEADPEVIQAAYRRLAQKFHPDVAQGDDAAARMSAINQAWAVLRHPDMRAAYDRERAAAGARSTPERSEPPSPAGPARSAAGSQGSAGSRGAPGDAPFTGGAAPRAETVSRDWTSGRSTVGGGYDPATMGTKEGLGGAGAPPGNASGSVLNFGRYAGWSLGEIARRDLEYLEWLDRVPIGRPYRDEIDAILRRTGRRKSAAADATERRGLFRRR
jgi:curved DNA-binding protein CbpA